MTMANFALTRCMLYLIILKIICNKMSTNFIKKNKLFHQPKINLLSYEHGGLMSEALAGRC